jgi:hypothetical protein
LLVASQSDNARLKTDNIRLHDLVATANAERLALMTVHQKATEAFAQSLAAMASAQGPPTKRARTVGHNEEDDAGSCRDEGEATLPAEEGGREKRRREEDTDQYVQCVVSLREKAHAKAVEELKAEHQREVAKLRAKAAEPVNEFRVSKQFHIKEADLKTEIQKLQRQLDVEKTKTKSAEFDHVNRIDDMRTMKELKLRCADRDRLVAEVLDLKTEMERRKEPYRGMECQELLGVIDVLKVGSFCVY